MGIKTLERGKAITKAKQPRTSPTKDPKGGIGTLEINLSNKIVNKEGLRASKPPKEVKSRLPYKW